MNQPEVGRVTPCAPPAPTFRNGDKVSFTIMRSNGRSISYSSRVGIIQTVSGDLATVLYRGTLYPCPVSELRHVGQKSALTEAFQSAPTPSAS